MLLALLLQVQSAQAAPGLTSALPFGIGVYLHHRPVRGVVYSVTQAAGLATWVGSTWPARAAAEEGDMETVYRWQAALIGISAFTLLSYGVSVLDSARLHELEDVPVGLASRALPDVPLRLPDPSRFSTPGDLHDD